MSQSFLFNNADFDIFYNDLKKDIKKKLNNGIEKYQDKIIIELKKNSPNKTGQYEKSHVKQIKNQKKNIIGTIESNLPYSDIIENGVKGKVYNYHKNKKIINTSVGNKTYENTYKKLNEKYINDIINNL